MCKKGGTIIVSGEWHALAIIFIKTVILKIKEVHIFQTLKLSIAKAFIKLLSTNGTNRLV